MWIFEFVAQSWESAVYTLVIFWAGYAVGQISAHSWYYNHFQKTLKRRIYQPSSRFESTQKQLANEGERRLDLLDRKAAESDLRLFSAALLKGFFYYLRESFSSW